MSQIRFSIHGNLIEAKLAGIITQSDVEMLRENLKRDLDFRNNLDLLIDLSNVEQVDLDSASMLRIARNPLLDESCKVAAIAPEAHVFGLTRMYQGLSGRELFKVFREHEPAMAYIAENHDF